MAFSCMRYLTPLIALFLTGCIVSSGASQEERLAYLQQYDRPQSIEQAIRNDTVAIGMTRREVRLILGEPGDVSRYETEALSRIDRYEVTGVREEWNYGMAGRRIIIQDGRVVAVSASRALDFRLQTLGIGSRGGMP